MHILNPSCDSAKKDHQVFNCLVDLMFSFSLNTVH